MRLNNHGWGSKEFLFSIVAILILLLVVAVNVHRLYDALDNTSYNSSSDTTNNNDSNVDTSNTDNNSDINSNDNQDSNEDDTREEIVYNEQYYIDYQNTMINATKNYIIYSSPSIPQEGLIVDLSTLINNNYINSLNDMLDGSVCSGYSKVFLSSDSSLDIKTYLNCSNYVTEGY